MGYQEKDHRTGERKRPATTFTLSPSVITALDDLAKRTGKSRSEVAELCIIYGLERYLKELDAKEKAKEERKPVNHTVETSEERYMRKILFDFDNDAGWIPTGQ